MSQGSRPAYESSIQPLKFEGPAYETDGSHEKFLDGALLHLSEITEDDFIQPRDLYERVYDQAAKDRFVRNVAGHLSGVTNATVRNRTLSVL